MIGLEPLPPEWVLIVADSATAGHLERALTAENLSVRVADTPDRLAQLLQLGHPAAAAVDLDLAFSAEAITALKARKVLMVLLSGDRQRLRQFGAVVPAGMEKPLSRRAFVRAIDGLLGRR